MWLSHSVKAKFVIPWYTDQAPLSMGYSWQEYWRRLPFPTPEASSRPRDGTRISCVSCIGRWVLFHCTSWISMGKILFPTFCFFFSPPHPSIGNDLLETPLEYLCNIIRDISVMLILPCDVSVCVAHHQLLWHCLCPWGLGDSVHLCSSSQWESVQGEVCSAQPRPVYIFFYPQSTENAWFATTYLPHPQGTWLKSCIFWGSIRVRRMNSGFNHCEIERRFWVFSSYIYVSWFTLWLF